MDRAEVEKQIAAAQGDNIEFSKNTLENENKDNIIYSGARILDPDSKDGKAFAEMYYAEIRSFSTDVSKIAKNIGAKIEDIQKIKEYLFFNDDFIADCAVAQSWQRLMLNKDIKKHDRTLIEHELYEMEIKKNNPTIEHDKAHALATEKYNYQKQVDDYYGNLKKNRKNK